MSRDVLLAQCASASQSTDPGSLELTDVIVTTAGTPPTRSFYLREVAAGPEGCMATATIDLGNCELDFGPARDSSGALVLNLPPPGTAQSGSLDQFWCPREGLGTQVSGTLTFDGVSCSAPPEMNGVVTPPDCYAGVFTLKLTSESADGGDGGSLTGTPFHLAGAACPIFGGMTASCGDESFLETHRSFPLDGGAG